MDAVPSLLNSPLHGDKIPASVSMRLDRLITLGLVSPLRRVLSRSAQENRRLPILMYHSISDDPEPAHSPYYKVCTSPGRFAEHMQWLAEAGYRGVTLSEGLAWLNAPVPKPQTPNPRSERLVAITFDDGFRDFHTAAFPALQRHGFTATMYLPTAFIGDERKSFKSRECLTWAEVRELSAAGMEFGSHTVNHPTLYKLSWDEIENELNDSRAMIEKRLGGPARTFAYPFAFPQENSHYTATLADLLRKLGYANCVTTIIGRMAPGADPFKLVRLPANSADDRALLLAKLHGTYDWLRLPQSGIRRAKYLLGRNSRSSTDPAPPLNPVS